MAKALKCEYEIDIPEFSKVSSEARDLVQKLLLADPDERLTADQCLSHPWLSGKDRWNWLSNQGQTTVPECATDFMNNLCVARFLTFHLLITWVGGKVEIVASIMVL